MKNKLKILLPIFLCFVVIISTITPVGDSLGQSLNSNEASNSIVNFTKVNYRSVSGDGHAFKSTDGGENMVTFKRNYSSVNTWSGGALQLKTDNNEYYKLKPSTAYNVKFDYCVESYKEAADAEFKDLSIMVSASKTDEGTWTNARSVSSRDLDTVTAAHKGEQNTDSNVKASTTGEYAAVGARVPYNAGGYGCDGTTHNWKTVSTMFTTKDTFTTASGTYDILTLAVVSHKTDAGDVQISFKNLSIAEVDLSTSMTKLNATNIGGSMSKSVDKSGSNIVTFSRNYSSVNTWSGGALQLKTDNNEYYKLKPSTAYNVKFDYCVESYKEAADAEFKDLSIMVSASKTDEGTWTNARSVSSRDLDTVTAAHKGEQNTDSNIKASTTGEYAAVGARVPYNAGGYGCDGTTHNWKTVSAMFTTKDTFATASGTYDILTLAVVSHKTDAGDVQVSFKDFSIELIDLSKINNQLLVNNLPDGDNKNGTIARSVDKSGDNVVTFSLNYPSENTWTGGALQLKYDNGDLCKLEPAKQYSISFDYCVDSYLEAADAQYKDLSIMVAASKEGETGWWNARSVTARDLDQITIAHRANEAATSGDYAAIGARVPYNAGGYGCDGTTHNWKTVSVKFITKDTLTTASGTYDVLTLAMVSNKTAAGDFKVSFKNLSFVNLSDQSSDEPVPPDEDPTHDPIYFYNAIPTGMVTYKYGQTTEDDYLQINRNSADNVTGFQLKKDKNTFYELEQYKGYRVSFSYKVDNYAQYRDYGNMYIVVGGSVDGETAWWEVRNVINNAREAISSSVRDKNKYPGVVISAETSDWVDAEVSFDIYNPVTNIVDDSKVYDNLTFLVLSGEPNGIEKVKTTVQFKNFKVEEVQLDNGNRTFVFDTMGGKDITSLYSNIRDFENLVLPIPSKDGSRFRGWYLNNSCTTLFNIDNFTADDSGNIYLYAGWQQLETGLNFLFNTVKKPHYYYEDLEENFSDYDEEDIVNNAKKIIKKRKKLVRVDSGDGSDEFPTTLVVILSIFGTLVIAGGITSFIIIRKKRSKI